MFNLLYAVYKTTTENTLCLMWIRIPTQYCLFTKKQFILNSWYGIFIYIIDTKYQMVQWFKMWIIIEKFQNLFVMQILKFFCPFFSVTSNHRV